MFWRMASAYNLLGLIDLWLSICKDLCFRILILLDIISISRLMLNMNHLWQVVLSESLFDLCSTLVRRANY